MNSEILRDRSTIDVGRGHSEDGVADCMSGDEQFGSTDSCISDRRRVAADREGQWWKIRDAGYRNEVGNGDLVSHGVITQWDGSKRSTCIISRQRGNRVSSAHGVVNDTAKYGVSTIRRIVVIRRPSVVRQIDEPLAGGAVRLPHDFRHRNCAAPI